MAWTVEQKQAASARAKERHAKDKAIKEALAKTEEVADSYAKSQPKADPPKMDLTELSDKMLAAFEKAGFVKTSEVEVNGQTAPIAVPEVVTVPTVQAVTAIDEIPEGVIPWESEAASYEGNPQPFKVSENGIGTREQVPSPTIKGMIEQLDACDPSEEVFMTAGDWLVILKKLVALSGDE